MKQMCNTCDGQGWIQVPVPDGDDFFGGYESEQVQCENCYGTGSVESEEEVRSR